ncbi:hypothetical protein [Candidatus Nitrososphaera evergladensis]|uniref:hypothetical protein n=1 Tax=Candidatus Nitrososphaera evergladensis TaxID=1459637 RepID=UPI0011E5CDA7|nr:hypothetical protein [Candidatus Nitrososphaera evergladensis]
MWKEKDDNLYFSSSSDRGQTFSGKVNLSKDYVEGWRSISIPSLWAQNGNVYVLWQAAGENGYLLLKSADGGRSFKRVTLPSPGEFNSDQSGIRQMIITEDGKAYILWGDFSEMERRISFATGYEGKPSTGNQTDLVKKKSIRQKLVHHPTCCLWHRTTTSMHYGLRTLMQQNRPTNSAYS